MAEVKWIKITTNMFEDEKIDFIESLPEADTILIIWVKLLTLAGKCNANGFIFLTEKIPYTKETLAHKFRRPLNTVKLALETLARLEMIKFDDNGFLKISNWEKHQNVEGLEKIREQNRLRKQRQRKREKERQKALEQGKENNSHVTSRDSHATEEELEGEEDIDIDIDKEELQQKSCKDDKPAKLEFKFQEDSTEIQLAKFMIETMLKIKPNSRVPNSNVKSLQNWAQHIDYMVRLDKRTPRQIAELFKWAQEDGFWCANIRSPRKLREKWDTLELQKDRNKPKGNSNLTKLEKMYQRALMEEEGAE